MAITSQSAIVAALPGQRQSFIKTTGSNSAWANKWISLWGLPGNPTAGSAPGSTNGVVPTQATTGAFNLTNAGGGNRLYLGRAALNPPTAGVTATVILYDRLLAASGFSATATPGSPTVVNRTAPGDSGAFKNELWLEVYTQTTTARTIALTYTDQSDNTGNVSGTVTLPATTPSIMIPVPLAAGDSGVKSVQVVTCSGATGGDFGFTVLRRLAEFTVQAAGMANIQDAIQLGMPDIPASACLAMMVQLSGITAGDLTGSISIIEG